MDMDQSQPITAGISGQTAGSDGDFPIKNMMFRLTPKPVLLLLDRVETMKLGGVLLLASGWGIVIAALVLLHGASVVAFILAGLATELLGLVVVGRAHLVGGEDDR